MELVMRTVEVSCDACGVWGVRMRFRHQVNCHLSRSLPSPTPKTLLSCGVALWNFEEWNPCHQYQLWRKAGHIVFQSKWRNSSNNEKNPSISQVLDAKTFLFPGSGNGFSDQLAVLLCGGREDVLKFWRQQDCLLWQDISPELIVRDCVGQTRKEKRTRYIHLGF